MKVTKSKLLHSDTSIIVPEGTYYIGDPCYGIPYTELDDEGNQLWDSWLEAADYKNSRLLAAELDGKICVGLRTMYGDGLYRDVQGRAYGVDSGLIGLVHADVANYKKYGLDLDGIAHLVIFREPIFCNISRSGIMRFTSDGHTAVRINTSMTEI